MEPAGVSQLGAAVWRARTSPALRQALLVTVVMRVAWGLVAAVAQPGSVGRGWWVDWGGLQLPQSGPAAYLLGPWLRDDAIWYQRIAAFGYRDHGSGAFFPLYPALTHAAGVVLGGAYLVAGLLVSTAATAGALYLLFELVRGDFDAGAASRTTWFVAFWPFAFFLLAPFSEATFLLLSAAVLLAARRRRHGLAAVCTALAVLCRAQGLLLLIPLAVEVLSDGSLAPRWRGRLRELALALLPPALAVAGLVVFSVRVLGGPFTMLDSQAFWGSHVAAPPLVLLHSVSAIAGGHHPEEFWNLVAATGALALVPLMLRRLPASYWAYGCALLAAIWFHEERYSPLMSAGRFLAVDFPMFAALALASPGWPRLVRRLVIVAPVLGAAFLANMVGFHFVG